MQVSGEKISQKENENLKQTKGKPLQKFPFVQIKQTRYKVVISEF